MRAILASITVAALSGCLNLQWEAPVVGSGVKATEKRIVTDFRRIEIAGSADVEASVGEEPSLLLETDDNLVELIATKVADETLTISTRGSIRTRLGVRVKLTAPEIESVAIRGSGDVHVDGVDGQQFAVTINGSGDVTASGKVDDVTVTVRGSGDVRLSELVAKNVVASISGSGDVRVHASETLSASIRGSGDVRYSGDPEVEKSVLGSGGVKKTSAGGLRRR